MQVLFRLVVAARLFSVPRDAAAFTVPKTPQPLAAPHSAAPVSRSGRGMSTLTLCWYLGKSHFGLYHKSFREQFQGFFEF